MRAINWAMVKRGRVMSSLRNRAMRSETQNLHDPAAPFELKPVCAFTVIVERMFTKPNASSGLRLTLQPIIVDQESL